MLIVRGLLSNVFIFMSGLVKSAKNGFAFYCYLNDFFIWCRLQQINVYCKMEWIGNRF